MPEQEIKGWERNEQKQRKEKAMIKFVSGTG